MVPHCTAQLTQTWRRPCTTPMLTNTIYKQTVEVTLDLDTAQPELILSAEGKQVRKGEIRQRLPDTRERFDDRPCVLGREGFTSGRRYWQVQVGENTRWRLGVSTESAERKGEFSMIPQQGYWTVTWWSGDRGEFTALTDPRTPLPLPRRLKPRRLGVYLDYEEGQLSVYNVETRSHIYTFTDMDFKPNEKLYPFFYTSCLTDLVLVSPDPVSAAH
ncbi:E3 ubiquitin-protein ligase TRIM39-like [Acipenser ruthenus]|uniref:E3 ubiquitin-protein ligase TRIM39-like n=1 Tax=Acipenser ruthenus TaxID=7906 RepID=UPI0027423678|nr:E3 ubiquitin-protein ligase TRIM39-like [Acipenser ruthenus]